jgi:hypothetical protein
VGGLVGARGGGGLVVGEEKSGVQTRVFSQSRCQAWHIPEMECAALAFMCGTFTLNVPPVS